MVGGVDEFDWGYLSPGSTADCLMFYTDTETCATLHNKVCVGTLNFFE